MEVIVVGGGIGGLSLALSLHQAGIGVRVYEAVSELRPLGVGINVQPAAVRELTELALGNELAKIGIPTRRLSYFNKFGQLIWSEPRGLSAGYRWPQYSIHRGQLQTLLLRATRERIGDSNFRAGMRFVGLRESRNRVTATFCDSSGASIVDDADVLVGADGIHSAVRHHLHPEQGEPRFAQQVLWRAAVEAEPFLGGDTMIDKPCQCGEWYRFSKVLFDVGRSDALLPSGKAAPRQPRPEPGTSACAQELVRNHDRKRFTIALVLGTILDGQGQLDRRIP
jgi:5-methylphenazine-1-carboxylate 1-monooxygenase